MPPEIVIPPDTIQVQRGQDMCPGCGSHTTPDVIDYQQRTVENPDRWRMSELFVLFQCQTCGGLYYIHEQENVGN